MLGLAKVISIKSAVTSKLGFVGTSIDGLGRIAALFTGFTGYVVLFGGIGLFMVVMLALFGGNIPFIGKFIKKVTKG